MRYFFLPLAVGVFSTCVWGQQYIINTFAGNGTAGYSGDSGAPGSAQLSSPDGIAFDSSGNLYIADSANQRIRKISGGTITTVAGNGTAGTPAIWPGGYRHRHQRRAAGTLQELRWTLRETFTSPTPAIT